MWYGFFRVRLLALNRMSLELTLLVYVSGSYFSLLSSVSLYEHTMIY